MLIEDNVESIIQERKSEPFSADQYECHITISGKMNIFSFDHRVGVCIGGGRGGGGGGGEWKMAGRC